MGIEPDAPAANAINQLRRDMPLQSINHTDLTALSTRPIVVSIETKRTGQSDQGAALQIGLWQAAQWKLLSTLLRGREPTPTPTASSVFDTAPEDPPGLKALSFLPAIIIHGHEWRFAATSREGRKTVSFFRPWIP
jgi:hypothetical protein